MKPSGAGWVARCPAHGDREASLSIGQGDDGKILVNCFAGCDPERIVEALGLTMADLFTNDGRGSRIPSRITATVQQADRTRAGCTLAQYAAAKRLPVDALRGFGLHDLPSYDGAPAIRIPYGDGAGGVAAVRFRVALEKSPDGGDRFKWKSGAKVCLYGRDRLTLARERAYCTLVEGESDCHTLWVQGEPAAGIPGANNWRDDRDASELEGITTIYVVAEPDQGGETLIKRLAHSRIRDRVKLIRLRDYKDPSSLYLADPGRFAARWHAALASAVPLVDVLQAEAREDHAEAWALCEPLATERDILARVAETVASRGVAGETRAVKLLYLILATRLLGRPVCASVKGPSSGGKSYLVDQVLALCPSDCYYALSAMSERALAYSEEPLSHRYLVIYEAAGLAGDFASYLARSLISEGRIRYETVEKTKDGMRARMIEREGPTGLIVTTTAVHLHPENETRMLSIPVTDTPDQTRHILRAIAAGAEGTAPPAPVDLSQWHALQRWLAGSEHRVTVPYARLLSELIPPVAVRLRRDFGLVLTLIQGQALLHQAGRPRDAEGRIVATLDDYAAVRALVADLVAEGVEASVPATVRETVTAVGDLLNLVHPEDGEDAAISVTQLAKVLKLDKGTTSRRVRVAVDREYLRNLETRRGKPARLTLGEPLPGEADVLPLVEAVNDCCTVAALQAGISSPPPCPEPVQLTTSELPSNGYHEAEACLIGQPDLFREAQSPPTAAECKACGAVTDGPPLCWGCR